MSYPFLKNLHEKLRSCSSHEDDAVDLREEIEDLTRAYSEAAQELFEREEKSLNSLVGCMKMFIEIHEQRKCIEDKLERLNHKIENAKCHYQHSGEK